MTILGIDPGTTRIGYGVIEHGREPRLIAHGVINLEKVAVGERLSSLRASVAALIAEYPPACAGIEQLYFAKNQKTALAVSEARGVILATMQEAGFPVYEVRPMEVKQSLTNYGHADKEAVRRMVARLLKIEGVPGHDDASDALAVALTAAAKHAFTKRLDTHS
jgi:crossover junction endodeoxyribonuclease RuvC